MQPISTLRFVNLLKDIQKDEDRQFCFVLGAGASVSAGIPTAGTLAKGWFDGLEDFLGQADFDAWKNGLGKKEKQLLNEKNYAALYSLIYSIRFENDPKTGYKQLIDAMKGKIPSNGHLILAFIMHYTRHNCVVTTNFDGLIETSLFKYTSSHPLVAGHESISQFAQPTKDVPLIVKVHRDLHTAPKSTLEDINKLDTKWVPVLDNIIGNRTPIVIGYGGNDGSMMTYFENMRKPDNIFWCLYKDEVPDERVQNMMEKQKGSFVKTDGFDEVMREVFHLFPEVQYKKEELEKGFSNRIGDFDDWLKSNYTQAPISGAVEITPPISAYEYAALADRETDLNKKETIYKEALQKYPSTAWLWGMVAHYYHFEKKEYEHLEDYYNRALVLGLDEAWFNCNYAVFLNDIRKDYDAAEKYYLKALEDEPNHATFNGNYAIFLKNIRKDYDAAEKYYLKALATEPNNSNNNGNYASFLHNIRKDYDAAEKHYLKALAAEPNLSNNNGNYAVFLKDIRKDYDAAEKHYLKALAAEPNHSINNGNYAFFLHDIRKDYDAAEKHYLIALAAEPNHSNNNGNYAVFLKDIRKDYDAAEKHYLKALAAEPNDANNNGNYANFLKEIRKDYDAAEKHYLKALAAEPNDSINNGNYAVFLKDIRKDYDAAEKHYLKALATELNDANCNSNYAQLLLIKGNPILAEKHLEIALANNPHQEAQLEIAFYQYAHFFKQKGKEAEETITTLLAKGIRAVYWNFEANIEKAITDGHPHPERLRELAKLINSPVERIGETQRRNFFIKKSNTR